MLDGAWLGTDRRQVVLFQSGQELSAGWIDDALPWITNGGKRYYVKEDGVMAANEIVVIDGKEYRFDGSGALKA